MEVHFRKLLDVVRKKKGSSLLLRNVTYWTSVCLKPACSHIHEVGAVSLRPDGVFIIVHLVSVIIIAYDLIGKFSPVVSY